MLLTSISIPFNSITCLLSEQSTFQIMFLEDDCIHEDHDNELAFHKDICCIYNTGVFDIDTDLVNSEKVSLSSNIAILTQFFIPQLHTTSHSSKISPLGYYYLEVEPVSPIIAFQNYRC